MHYQHSSRRLRLVLWPSALPYRRRHLSQGLRASGGGQMRFLAGFLAGLVWSNWTEYAYHRWAMHWPSLYQPAAMRHALHHSAPSDPRHITMNVRLWSAIFLIIVLFFVFLIHLFSQR